MIFRLSAYRVHILLLLIVSMAGALSAQPSAAWTSTVYPEREEGYAYKAPGFVRWDDGRRLALYRSGVVELDGPETDFIRQLAERTLVSWPDSLPKPEVYILDELVPSAGHSPSGLILLNTGLLANLESEAEIAYIIAFCGAHIALGTPEVLPAPVPYFSLFTFGNVQEEWDFPMVHRKVCTASTMQMADSMANAWLQGTFSQVEIAQARNHLKGKHKTVAELDPALLFQGISEIIPAAYLQPFAPEPKRVWIPGGYADSLNAANTLFLGELAESQPIETAAINPEFYWNMRRKKVRATISWREVSAGLLGAWENWNRNPDTLNRNMLKKAWVTYAMVRAYDSKPDESKSTSASFRNWANQFSALEWACLGLYAAWDGLKRYPQDDFWVQATPFLMDRIAKSGGTYSYFFQQEPVVGLPEWLPNIFSEAARDAEFRGLMLKILEEEKLDRYEYPLKQGKKWNDYDNPHFVGAEELEPGEVLVLPAFWIKVIGDRKGYFAYVPATGEVAERKKWVQDAFRESGLNGRLATEKDATFMGELQHYRAWKYGYGNEIPYPEIGKIHAYMRANGLKYILTHGVFLESTRNAGGGKLFGTSFVLALSVPAIMPMLLGQTLSNDNNTYLFQDLYEMEHLQNQFSGIFHVKEKDRKEIVKGRYFDFFVQLKRRMGEKP